MRLLEMFFLWYEGCGSWVQREISFTYSSRSLITLHMIPRYPEHRALSSFLAPCACCCSVLCTLHESSGSQSRNPFAIRRSSSAEPAATCMIQIPYESSFHTVSDAPPLDRAARNERYLPLTPPPLIQQPVCRNETLFQAPCMP
jgi:hypothetical protein